MKVIDYKLTFGLRVKVGVTTLAEVDLYLAGIRVTGTDMDIGEDI